MMIGLAMAIGVALLSVPGAGDGAVVKQWTPQPSGVTARLRGVSVVNDRVAWASGAAGTILRTIDGGHAWEARSIAGTESADFRDIDAIDHCVAYVLSIGPGEASRIYKTVDGGTTWALQFVNREPKAFFDAMAFWDAERGLAISDSVDGRFIIIRTVNGGRDWAPVPDSGLPAALPGEGAFAASGTSVAVYGTHHAWIGTGASDTARVLRTEDGGETWTVSATPLPAGPSAGIFSVAFRDAARGIVVGGDYKQEKVALSNAAVTGDGGATWALVPRPGLSGFRSAVSFVRTAGGGRILALGPSGADASTNGGRQWTSLSFEGFHALAFARDGTAGWAVGEGGRIAFIQTQPASSPKSRSASRRTRGRAPESTSTSLPRCPGRKAGVL